MCPQFGVSTKYYVITEKKKKRKDVSCARVNKKDITKLSCLVWSGVHTPRQDRVGISWVESGAEECKKIKMLTCPFFVFAGVVVAKKIYKKYHKWALVGMHLSPVSIFI